MNLREGLGLGHLPPQEQQAYKVMLKAFVSMAVSVNCFQINRYPSKYIQYAKLFNYLWSFSAGNSSVKGPLSERAGMALSVVMLKNPGLSVPLYESRREIDWKSL